MMIMIIIILLLLLLFPKEGLRFDVTALRFARFSEKQSETYWLFSKSGTSASRLGCCTIIVWCRNPNWALAFQSGSMFINLFIIICFSLPSAIYLIENRKQVVQAVWDDN